MPCPFSGSGDDSPARQMPRRDFVVSALAAGGTGALSACLSREREEAETTTGTPEFPTGPDDLSALPERQHAWNDYLIHDGHGNTVLPRHQVLLFLDYTGSIPPTGEERDRVERAFESVERAYQRGTGGRRDAMFNAGLLFMLGYSPSYFDRFDDAVPASAGLATPEHVLEELSEDPEKADPHDAALVLSSDYASVLLATEEALFGDVETLNGTAMDADLRGVFERTERRTGFVGRGLPARKLDVEEIPKSAPLSMGFKSGFTGNQATEDAVTIDRGPFAGGTTQMVSRLSLGLDRWYDRDDERRVDQMFSPEHSLEEVGETAQLLGNDSDITEDIVQNLERDAEQRGVVGHSQKVAAARDENFDPVILRRSEGNATDEDGPEMNFSSVQRRIEDFVDTRKAMNMPELDDAVEDEHHGIRNFVDTVARATFLVPPRRLRSLPAPRPDA